MGLGIFLRDMAKNILESSLHYTLFRYGSRINNDRFPEQAPKEQAVKGMLPREIFLDFGVSELFAQ